MSLPDPAFFRILLSSDRPSDTPALLWAGNIAIAQLGKVATLAINANANRSNIEGLVERAVDLMDIILGLQTR